MAKICYINLSNNPINYIYKNDFLYLPNLKHVIMYDTQVFLKAEYNNLIFLENLKSNISLTWWKGQFFDIFKDRSMTRHKYPHVKYIDLSNNVIQSRKRLEAAFRVFPNIESISLQSCSMRWGNFLLSNPHVTFFDASSNNIPTFPSKTFKHMPRLQTVLLSKNLISSLTGNLFNLTPDLEMLDLSYNNIDFISSTFFINSTKKFQYLLLRNNYLTQNSLLTFPSSLLQNISVFDIRLNSFVCSCKLTKNLGQWLVNSSFSLEERPGMLPYCSPVMHFYSGCVNCQNDVGVFKETSLLNYCSNKSCQARTSVWLCLLFTGLTAMFLFVGIFVSSLNVKTWLSKQALKHVLTFSASNWKNQTIRRSLVYAYHAYVYYDIHNSKTVDWIDKSLIPNLERSCNITIRGRDDQCGTSPVKEMLNKIEASRKVIVDLSDDYKQSNEVVYMLSVLDHLDYQHNLDKTIIISFHNNHTHNAWFNNIKRKKHWNIIAVPDEDDQLPVLWSSIETILLKL